MFIVTLSILVYCSEYIICDRKMKKRCEYDGIKTIWGLQVMLMLVMKGILLKKEAMITAEKICEINPRIGQKVLEDFKKKLL